MGKGIKEAFSFQLTAYSGGHQPGLANKTDCCKLPAASCKLVSLSYPALYIPDSGLLTSLPREAPNRFVAGRSTRANFCVPDGAWSREQFCIRIEPGASYLEQLSQKVPTLVNGKRVDAPHRLKHGDMISVSSTGLVYLERADPRYGKAPAAEDAGLTRKEDGRAAAERVAAPGELPLDRDAIIGRDRSQVDLALDHPRVSRRHAQVVVSQGRVSLRDLSSSNGTFVNGERIDGFRVLQIDDRIDIGPYSFRFTGRSLVQSSREGNLRIVGYNLSRTVRSHAGGNAKIRILDNVTLVVEPREFVCILGASGSGKSTLMHALSARAPADSGQVFLNDVSLYANFQALKQGIAFVPQQDVLHESLTLSQALTFTAQLRLPPDTPPAGIKAAVASALDRVDLGPRAATLIGNLSGGQKKRASLANEIVSRPNLLFLDEVTSGLDEGTDWEMMKLFRRMAGDGMTIVCVTHTVANVEDFCHKIVVMANPGVLAFYGTPAEARKYFGVDKLGDVYRVLASKSGEEWRDQYQQSPECKRYITSRLGPPPGGAEKAPAPADQGNWLKNSLPEARRQFGILARRYGELVFSDRKTLGLAAAQSLLVGILLTLVFGTVESTGPKPSFLLFFLGISCLWYGCNNAAKEIVKERPIYRLERDVNLSVASYVLSKMALLSVVGLGQVTLLLAVVAVFSGIPGGSGQFVAMSVTMLAGTATGLLLSAVSRTNDQASTLVPIALIPQILLAGVIVPNLPTLANFLAHTVVSGFWVYKSMAAILKTDSSETSLALFILLLHTVACLFASGYILFVRDARGELIYGKAIGRWVKQASQAKGAASPGKARPAAAAKP
jgi:ABC-type multidrug transport system ATPase subunit